MIQLGDRLPSSLRRDPQSHKGTYGRVVAIGGSIGMSGAIAMTARATLRSGAGLVTVATGRPNVSLVAGFDACLMTLPLPADEQGRVLSDAVPMLREQDADCYACGPGLGSHESMTTIVSTLYRELPAPTLFDADGLNALARRDKPLPKTLHRRILTPHPGEFARLCGEKFADLQKQRAMAKQFAAEHKVVLVLKGHQTLVTDGDQVYQNDTGNPGMATGGAGDVLTGVISALVGQGLDPLEAACWGVRVHGHAGDLAAASRGQIGMIATDIIEFLPVAFQEFSQDGGG